MSQFIYNGIEFQLIKTNSVERIVRMSEDRVDYLWTDFIIDLNCIYNPGATSYPVAGTMPAATDVTIRSFLAQPRKPLYYAEGGIAILDIPINLSSGDAIDCEDGPTVLTCNITRIGSAAIFFIRYVIKASIIECPAGTIISAIASSRYSRSESFDSQYRSTIVTSGRAYFRSNVLAALAQDADSFRGYIIPNPLQRYKRMMVNVSLDSNGILMDFSATDYEQFIDLGSPYLPGTAGSFGITDMDLEYDTSTISHGEMGFTGIRGTMATVNAMAIGARTANTYTMLQFLLRCALNKLGNLPNTGLLQNFAIKENVFKNTISMSITFNSLPPDNQLANAKAAVQGFVGVPIASLPDTSGIEPFPPFSNATRGMSAYVLATSNFADACYANITSVGGCDDSGSTPPDASSYYGQCPGSPQVFIYQMLSDPTSPDFRQPGKQNFRGPSPQQTSYYSYSVVNHDETYTGLVAVPTAPPMQQQSLGGPQPGTVGPNPLDPTYGTSGSNPVATQIALQLFQPMTRQTVLWKAERYGCVPEVPDPSPTQQGYALLKVNRSPVAIDVGPDGTTPIYRITGSFAYAKLYPTYDNDALPFPIPPWINAEPNELLQIEEIDYLDGIINNPVS